MHLKRRLAIGNVLEETRDRQVHRYVMAFAKTTRSATEPFKFQLKLS